MKKKILIFILLLFLVSCTSTDTQEKELYNLNVNMNGLQEMTEKISIPLTRSNIFEATILHMPFLIISPEDCQQNLGIDLPVLCDQAMKWKEFLQTKAIIPGMELEYHYIAEALMKDSCIRDSIFCFNELPLGRDAFIEKKEGLDLSNKKKDSLLGIIHILTERGEYITAEKLTDEQYLNYIYDIMLSLYTLYHREDKYIENISFGPLRELSRYYIMSFDDGKREKYKNIIKQILND